jgi:hypothetical protein
MTWNHKFLVALSTLLVTAGIATGADAQAWRWNQQPNRSVSLQQGDTVVWQFHYGPDDPKPYFHPVALPDGRVLTWNRPPDHVWHHGLWFCWKYINGVNYWEPDASGKPPGRTEWSDVQIATGDDGTARIQLDLDYHPAGGASVLTERRVVEISAPAADGRYFFDWVCRFTAGQNDVELNRTPLPGEPGGQAWGGYAGLSVRLAGELTDRGATSTDGPVPFNAEDRYRGRALALDYHGLVDGRAVGVAICDHPQNLNHPSPWYVIRSQAMSYFSPAVICYAPHTLPAGQSLTLRYRVIVHPDRWDAERLQAEYAQFTP